MKEGRYLLIKLTKEVSIYGEITPKELNIYAFVLENEESNLRRTL
jgi:hypothetical protein